jgi:AcrR family transcriptional regulator
MKPSQEAVDRTAIVEAASRLFYEHGVRAVGMDAVRSSAGVPLKRVYRAFRSKEDLVEATLRSRDAALRDAVEEHLAREVREDPKEAVVGLFDWMHAWFAEPDFRGCAFINAYGELGHDLDVVAAAVRDHKLAFRKALARLVSRLDLQPDEADALTEQLYIVANGAMAVAPITGSPRTALDAKAAARALVEQATSWSGDRGDAARAGRRSSSGGESR